MNKSDWHRLYPPWVTLALCLLMLGIFIAPAAFQELLIFDRHAVMQGEWHRLVSCHFVHQDLPHLLINLPVILVVGSIYESLWGLRCSLIILATIALGSAVVMAWIWWFYPAVLFYVGISGPALTFMVVIVYEVYLDTGYKWVWLIPLYFISKNMLQLDYPIYGERDPSTFYPAHNVALVTGFFWIFIQHLTRSFQSTTKAITID